MAIIRFDTIRCVSIRFVFHHLLTLHEHGQLLVVVGAEVAAKGFHDARQLALSGATICHEIGHHSACFLPREVGIHKFGSTYVRSKDREKHGNDGLVHVFRHLRGQKSHAFGVFSQAWYRWRGSFTEIVFHILLVVK